MKKGWALVDVSPPEDFAEFHAAGAVNVPAVLYGTPAEGGAAAALKAALLQSQAPHFPLPTLRRRRSHPPASLCS